MEKVNTKLSFKKIFILFILGAFAGYILENIMLFIDFHKWENRHDLFFMPLTTLYGFGTLLYILLLHKKSENLGLIKTFLYCALIGGITEYLTSFLTDTFLNIKFWDYTGMLLNIGGRTTVPFMCAWGILGTILLKVIYPKISSLVDKMNSKISNIIYKVLLILIAVNLVFSYSATLRFFLRNNGYDSITFIGRFFDEKCNNTVMYKEFPVLKLKED